MSGKWTSGPWRAEPSCDEDENVYWSDDLNAAVWTVATPHTNDTATWLIDSIREPDAHLIAAAPDLYEALDGLSGAAGEVADFLGEEDWTRVQAVLDGYIVAARAALAKARGETA